MLQRVQCNNARLGSNFCARFQKLDPVYRESSRTTRLRMNSPSRIERIFVYIPKVLGKRRQHVAPCIRRRINVRKEKYRTQAATNRVGSEAAAIIIEMNYSLSPRRVDYFVKGIAKSNGASVIK